LADEPATGDAPAPGDAPEAPPLAGAWLELSVEADVEAVEAVSEILGRFAPGGTSAEPAFELVEEGLGARIDPTRPSIVRAYVPARDPAAAERAAADAAEALGHLQAFGLRPIGELATRTVHEADWAEAWKAHFPVLRVGRRIVIKPTWRDHVPAPGDVVLDLDPGMAFGTGLHPTTRLCLAATEAVAERGLLDGTRVLDVGCGSGILAIAAAKLGAAGVLGVDTDPIAVEATIANAARNGLAGRIAARAGSLPTGSPSYDVVLANLIASVLIALAGPLRDELRPGGVLVASGIFVDREADVRGAFDTVGLSVATRTAEGDWVALEATRR
jgi:ribosomal protein L11 methyltransferase